MRTFVKFLTRKPFLGARALLELERVIALVRADRIDTLREITGRSYYKSHMPGLLEYVDRDLSLCEDSLPADAISMIYRRVRYGGMKRGASLSFHASGLSDDIRAEVYVHIPEHIHHNTIVEVPFVEWGDDELECECTGINYGRYGMSLSLWGWGIAPDSMELQQRLYALPSYRRLERELRQIWGDCERFMVYST